MKPISASDYLWDVKKHEIPPFCAVYGGDEFLKYQAVQAIRSHVLKGDDAEFSLSRFNGKDVKLETVLSELAAQSMFGDRRLIWLEDAQLFLGKKDHRDAMEAYAGKPYPKSVLLLELTDFPAAAKPLFSKLVDVGFLVNAEPPSEAGLPKWIVRWAKQQHQVAFDADAAAMLVDLIGTELGMIDQEIAKLALFAPPKGSITSEIVKNNVDNWRSRTIYEMLDLALAGKTAEAIRQLDRLLISGEKENKILNWIAPTLRKFGAATQIILDAEKVNQKIPVGAALSSVGVYRNHLAAKEQQLKMFGRRRGAKILDWLLQADLDFKGGSRTEPRLVLETLIVRISDRKFK